jgi:hypothetical protein
MVRRAAVILFALGIAGQVRVIDGHRNGPAVVGLGARDRVVDGPAPIRAEAAEDAIPLILEGKGVELPEVRDVHTVLTRLAGINADLTAHSKTAPNYDLCQLSVAGSNLFCGDPLRSEKYPRGVPRIEMPQLEGKPRPGSRAD